MKRSIADISMPELVNNLASSGRKGWLVTSTDEMSPSIPEGCAALVDYEWTEFCPGEIHAIDIDGEHYVTRLFAGSSKSHVIASPDNFAYPSEVLSSDQFSILGRVVAYFWSRNGFAIEGEILTALPINASQQQTTTGADRLPLG